MHTENNPAGDTMHEKKPLSMMTSLKLVPEPENPALSF